MVKNDRLPTIRASAKRQIIDEMKSARILIWFTAMSLSGNLVRRIKRIDALRAGHCLDILLKKGWITNTAKYILGDVAVRVLIHIDWWLWVLLWHNIPYCTHAPYYIVTTNPDKPNLITIVTKPFLFSSLLRVYWLYPLLGEKLCHFPPKIFTVVLWFNHIPLFHYTDL